MSRRGILSLAMVVGLVVASLVAPVAFAGKGGGGNAHILDKKTGWSRDSLDVSGSVAGLANADYLIKLLALGYADATCVSPGGNEEVQGRNPVLVEGEGEDQIRTDKNGSASFTLSAEDPTSATISPSPSPKEAGCPNGNWDVILGPVYWTEAWLFLYDATGTTLVDQAHYTCDITTAKICTLVK